MVVLFIILVILAVLISLFRIWLFIRVEIRPLLAFNSLILNDTWLLVGRGPPPNGRPMDLDLWMNDKTFSLYLGECALFCHKCVCDDVAKCYVTVGVDWTVVP